MFQDAQPARGLAWAPCYLSSGSTLVFSKDFITTGIKAIGLKSVNLVMGVLLGAGIITALLKFDGILHSCSEVLKIL